MSSTTKALLAPVAREPINQRPATEYLTLFNTTRIRESFKRELDTPLNKRVRGQQLNEPQQLPKEQ